VKGCLKLVEPYLQVLERETAYAGALAAQGGMRVRSVYLGGGTPTTLSPEQLDRVMAGIGKAFDLTECLEYTVEAGRPDTITPEKLAVLRRRGGDRVSVNPQSMRGEVLQAMGRAHTPADTLRAYAQVRDAGFRAVNMDLIAGLPADDPAGFQYSLDAVLDLAPENITVHTLALKRGSALLAGGRETLPDGAAVAGMLDYAWDKLWGAGYVPYYLYRQKYMSGSFENVGWCRPGFESVYNIAMMEEHHTILSLGGGGVTKLVDPARGQIRRITTPKYPHDYIGRADQWMPEKQALLPFWQAARGERK
jgi:oxygen-independent coproporphyrinogen-3 oxidase